MFLINPGLTSFSITGLPSIFLAETQMIFISALSDGSVDATDDRNITLAITGPMVFSDSGLVQQ
jgi:hypothetical protein